MSEDFDWESAFEKVTSRACLRRQGAPRLRDSKKLSAQQRDVLFEHITEHGMLKHAAAFVDARVIDAIGIVNAAHEAAALALAHLGVSPLRAEVLLDAGLKAPSKWRQSSHVRGDETIPVIAFASIIAKVSRDRLMEDFSEVYAPYRFETHKGYGTLAHRKALKKFGPSDIHRVTFCSRVY